VKLKLKDFSRTSNGHIVNIVENLVAQQQ